MEDDTITIQNEIECIKCGDRIYSGYRHDFKVCSCGLVGVDGGLSYLRRVGNRNDYIERSVSIKTKVIQDSIKTVKQALDEGKNEFGTVLALIRVLMTHEIITVDINGHIQ